MLLKIIDLKVEDNYLKLQLLKPDNFVYYPGQYVDLTLEVKDLDKRGKTRAFTLASSPTEDFLLISTTKGISDFKHRMQSLTAKETIKSSHPVGTFILDETEPAVFLAGGVGITPFRSMIKYAVDKKLDQPLTLIYSHHDDQFLFKKELEEWQTLYPQLNVVYHNSGKNGRLDKNKIQKILSDTSATVDSIFYIAGSPPMVADLHSVLKQLGVGNVNIRTDAFDGY